MTQQVQEIQPVAPKTSFEDAMKHLRILWDLRASLEGSPLLEQYKISVNVLNHFVFTKDMEEKERKKSLEEEEKETEVEKEKSSPAP